jgi:hypothetical protein
MKTNRHHHYCCLDLYQLSSCIAVLLGTPSALVGYIECSRWGAPRYWQAASMKPIKLRFTCCSEYVLAAGFVTKIASLE